MATVSLGFTNKRFPAGVHICQVFSNENEREEALLNFALSGVQDGECVHCLSDRTPPSRLHEFLTKNGVDWRMATESGLLALNETDSAYFNDGRFSLERMLALLENYYGDCVIRGKAHGARMIGEMAPKIQHVEGGSRLLEYESKVSLLLRKCPVTTVCQYDAHLFGGALIMDVLKVHPLMVIRGTVVNNPFYVKPEEFLLASA